MNRDENDRGPTDTDNLAPLKAIDRWAVGEQERGDPKAEKYIKRAYCPRTGQVLKSNEPEMWTCSYEEALRVKEKWGLEYLVFLLTEDDPYHCTDLDKIGSVDDPGVQQIIREQDTYTELSLNGKGLHLYGIATKPENQRKKDFLVNGVETESYDRMRYVVVAGKAVHDVPIGDVQAWVEENIPKKEARDGKVEPSPVDASDEEILEMALFSKNGERFRKLFYEGDVSIYDGDESRADMALCGMLAYWTGCDKERMDRIFRSSALYREKWNREDYSENTVQTAIDNCTSTYNPEKYEADKEAILRELHGQRMDADWKRMEACMVYRAHISLVEEHPRFVEEGEIKNIHGKDVVIPETGVLIYSAVRDLSLGSGIEYKEDPRNISRANSNLEKMGLLRLVSRGATNKGSSCYLLPLFSLRTHKKETHSLTREIHERGSVFPLCVLSEKLLWIQHLSPREKFVLEQIAWGRNTVQSLSEYYGTSEKTLLYRYLEPLRHRGFLTEVQGEYSVVTEKIEEMYRDTSAEIAHETQKARVQKDREENKEAGEDANLKRSMEKVEACLRGEVPYDELTPWERNQAFGRGLRALSKRKSRGEGPSPPGSEKTVLKRSNND